MSFISRASLNNPPLPPGHTSTFAAVENDIKSSPIPPFEPIENKGLRKSRWKPVRRSEGGDHDHLASAVEGDQGKVGVASASVPAEATPISGGSNTRNNDKINIMRRVSSIFKGKRKAPANLNLGGKTAPSAWSNRKAIGTIYIAEEPHGRSYDSDIDTCDESEDDIRRPSGLGSAVSLVIPPSPSWLHMSSVPPTKPNGSMGKEKFDPSAGKAMYPRSRTASSPNLIRSFTVRAKDKIRKGVEVARRVSQAQNRPQDIIQVPGTFSPLPPVSKSPPVVQFRSEVLELVLSHLPQAMIATLCTLSKSIYSAGRARLYRRLELDTLSPAKLQRLLATLASRRELPDLVHECICRAWPDFFAKPPQQPDDLHEDATREEELDGETQLRNTLLIATFTLALQRMSNLTKLTLPAFDASLLAQHTAFGLRSLTFMCSRLSNEEMGALFNWLNGQINVVELKFPNLEDSLSSNGNPDGEPYLQLPSEGLGPTTSPLATPIVASATPLPVAESVRITSPSPSAMGVRRSLFGSQTLLPSLMTLHATPAILSLLQPASHANTSQLDLSKARDSIMSSTSGVSSSSSGTFTRRPLRNVHLNISTTLYTGLRPNAVMANLKAAGVKVFGIRFGEDVDKRTVEKCLYAIAAILGTNEILREGGQGQLQQWTGVEELEVSFKSRHALMPGMEETLYKTIQSSLPRYTSLRKLSLQFHRPPASTISSASPTLLLSPAPPPLMPPEDWEVTLKLKGKKNVENFNVFKFPAPPVTPNRLSIAISRNAQPSTPGGVNMVANGNGPEIRTQRKASPPTSRPSPEFMVFSAKDGEGAEEGDLEKWNEKDRGRVQAWVRVCPTLRRVEVAGVPWECRGPPVLEDPNPAISTAKKDTSATSPDSGPAAEKGDPTGTEEAREVSAASVANATSECGHKADPSLPPPLLPLQGSPTQTPCPTSLSPVTSVYGSSLPPVPAPHLVTPVLPRSRPLPHPPSPFPEPHRQTGSQAAVASLFPTLSISHAPFPFQPKSRSPVRSDSIPTPLPPLSPIPPELDFSETKTNGGGAGATKDGRVMDVRASTSEDPSQRMAMVDTSYSTVQKDNTEQKEKARARLESMRILAKIRARDQRWVPRDAELEEDDHYSEGEEEEEESEVQEAVHGELRKPHLHSEPSTPKKSNMKGGGVESARDDELQDGRRPSYATSLSSRVTTEGSISLDSGYNFTSRFGDTFLQDSEEGDQERQSREYGYASAYRDELEEVGGIGVESLPLTRYIESDSEESEAEESIGVPLNCAVKGRA